MMVLGRLFGRAGADASDVDVAEARRRQEAGALLVDVREPEEWTAGHAPSAQHIPLGRLANKLAGLPRDRDVLFVCHSGARSGRATDLARRAGLTRALNVRGGMSAWARAGLPVAR